MLKRPTLRQVATLHRSLVRPPRGAPQDDSLSDRTMRRMILAGGQRRGKMYHDIVSFPAKIEGFVRKHGMIRPGDRVGVAVSGGADSVALLRALRELHGDLGCVLAVVHFNHKIRAEADSDAEFVRELAEKFGLEFFCGEGDAEKFARARRVSLETAARELRYGFFSQLGLNKIATAHTLDDQAETVLMKLLRGAGTKGMSGICPFLSAQYPVLSTQNKQVPRSARDDNQKQTLEIIRPMLGLRRREVEEYLRSLGQEWREDATNRDVKHTRNKVRHELLPLLERAYNPNIYRQLADAAEVARAEEEFWAEKIARREAGGGMREEQSPRHCPSTRDDSRVTDRSIGDSGVDLESLLDEPLAVRRRVVREAFRQASGKSLDFEHTDELVRFLERRESSRLQLPEYWFAVLDWPKRRVTFEHRTAAKGGTLKAGITSKKKGRIAARRV